MLEAELEQENIELKKKINALKAELSTYHSANEVLMERNDMFNSFLNIYNRIRLPDDEYESEDIDCNLIHSMISAVFKNDDVDLIMLCKVIELSDYILKKE